VSDIKFKLVKWFLPAALLIVIGCSKNQKRIECIDDSLSSSAQFLISKQSPDGAWRSETYGCFKDGPTLTPYIISCLYFLPEPNEQIQTSFQKAVDYLIDMVDEDGNIRVGPFGLNFPVYTAASASRVIVLQDKSEKNRRAQTAWLNYLLARRLDESLGWEPSDPEYGGWSFSINIPRKPPKDKMKDSLLLSNLTATIFGIGALRSARIAADEPIWEDILIFVKKCQNYSDDATQSDPRFDDGGFFFCPADPMQNKAGIAGRDKFGRQRYHSYGSMSADGLRALLACGLTPDHPRVVAAKNWLEYNFTVKNNPGKFNEDREVLRNATYYYYLWSVAHAFTRLGVTVIETKNGKVTWPEEMADEIIRRQRPDGSWVNHFTDAKEDDPLVSTPWAAAALVNCRQLIVKDKTSTGKDCIQSRIQTEGKSTVSK